MKQFNVRLEIKQHAEFAKIAKRENRTMSQLTRIVIEQFIAKEKKK